LSWLQMHQKMGSLVVGFPKPEEAEQVHLR
jgi:hypothetical protein